MIATFRDRNAIVSTRKAKKLRKSLGFGSLASVVYSSGSAVLVPLVKQKKPLAVWLLSFTLLALQFLTPEILKADLIAPRVDIIARRSPVASVSETLGDKRKLLLNIISEHQCLAPTCQVQQLMSNHFILLALLPLSVQLQ
ncbi:hypothetical protein Fmac_031137 [Flemingia macrophylla]|uniref:Uncharacterized protein n=1 Tax=Flemingia macrophylla TaxID=520843 RepID=A0ABD1L191_9FABA